jgi:putative transcriptional regulator
MEAKHLSPGTLTGQFLVAMPGMGDPRFARTVIYMCAHNEDGAMGLVVNRELDSLKFDDLLEQLGVKPERASSMPILFGGPVETGRGFVLHTTDYRQDATMGVTDNIALTATVDILRAIADGKGPRRALLALGYAGWAPNQIEGEIKANGWLTVSGDEALLFDPGLEAKWDRALGKLGISASMLSAEAGRA